MEMSKWVELYKYNRVCRITVRVGIASLVVIIIMKLTEWRPIPDLFNINEDGQVNGIIEGLTFSLLGACIFFIINEVYPKKQKWEVNRNYAKSNLQRIYNRFQRIVHMFRPFYFGATRKKYTESEFLSLFIQEDLFDGKPRSYKERIEDEKDYIVTICEKLMGSYMDYLTNDEIKYIQTVLNSYFVLNSLDPIEWSIPEEMRHAYPNNQKEFGRNIFKLYSTKLPSSVR